MCYTKNFIRKQLLNKRNNFIFGHDADLAIYSKLLSECDKYSRIFTYINYGSEVNTISFIEEMLKRKKEILVPVCHVDNCTMDASLICDTGNFTKNRYGILEPVEIKYDNNKIDAIIIPGSAFDIYGNRIGYGKGYYDKYISNLNYNPVKIGICYDFQLLDNIPSEEHDIKMNIIITESRTLYL